MLAKHSIDQNRIFHKGWKKMNIIICSNDHIPALDFIIYDLVPPLQVS